MPTTALRVFHAFTSALEPFLITGALYYAGVGKEIATGAIRDGCRYCDGHWLLSYLYLTLVYDYAHSNDIKGKCRKQYQISYKNYCKQVMMLTFAYGIPAVAVCYFLAEPLTSTFFHSTGAARYLQLLWPCFLFRFFVMPLQAYLIGLGIMKEAFVHGVWATIIAFADYLLPWFQEQFSNGWGHHWN